MSGHAALLAMLSLAPAQAALADPLSLASPGRHHVAAGGEILVLSDWGGDLEARAYELQDLEAAGTPVRVRGDCQSACTLYLGLSRTCVEPGSLWMFHGPRAPDGAPALPPEWVERYAQGMAELYPAPLAAWFLAEGRHGDHWLSGAQVIALGAQACGDAPLGGVMASTSR